ncbi:NAD-dependent succinate-semialdehyde dehydrogenase [Pigmentiphaga soli]|uniref:NAD-dependent succinate-semialdehyde dehydrogenase n=1 Tax=Pigmentiphaga soli TaxID=1007095 RepID=A0ABP8GUU8_9BURK
MTLSSNDVPSAFSDLRMLIDGRWTAGSGMAGEPVFNPATEGALGRLPHAGPDDLERAVAAAARSFDAWAATPACERRQVLLQAARLLASRIDAIARILTLEQGKPLAEARAELAAAIEVFEWYAEETRRLYGRVIPARSRAVAQVVQHEPVGPVAAFTPWNFPALTPARKIAGALAAGCTVVLKPSEETPATALELARACVDAGLPAGVLNVVFGVPAQVSEYLVRHAAIRKITFTGSIPVGKHLAQLAAAHGLKRCTLELGGHAPVLVFDDAQIEQAARVCAAGRFRNAGQVCVAPSRFYVQRGVAERFTAELAAAARLLVPGDGLDPAATMGPLANPRRLAAMQRYVEDALAAGGRVETGGRRLDRPGHFFEPTVLGGMPDRAAAMCEETFGPIAPVTVFDTPDEALARANALPYGLAAYAFTESPRTAAAVARGLSAGMVGINHLAVSLAEAPFGGVRESGYGSEGGTEGLDAYLSPKFVTHLSA